jgi:hypothetical protein
MEYRNRNRADDDDNQSMWKTMAATCAVLTEFGDPRPVL